MISNVEISRLKNWDLHSGMKIITDLFIEIKFRVFVVH
jgi:hypothetical protein